jgi:hypothetical protein
MSIAISGTTGITLDGQFNSASSMGFKNRIINGAMVIDQRNAGAAVTANGAYPVDRFLVSFSADGAYSAQQSSITPAGFINSAKFTTTTADASLTGVQRLGFVQRIEGLNIADLAWGTASAATVTLSFWVRSSLTGTFGGTLKNSDNNRSYPFTYTISVADTWEQKSVTIAGDTSGTWLTTNGVGIRLEFGLGCGPDGSGTAGAWTASNLFSATGALSVIGTLNATWYITGVQLEKGSTATSFDYRPYGTELTLCQRYYYKLTEVSYAAMGMCSATTVARLNVPFPVSMRTAPTALEQSGTAAEYNVNTGGSAVTCSSVPAFLAATTNNAATTFTVASGLTTGNGAFGRGAGYLAWSAEL